MTNHEHYWPDLPEPPLAVRMIVALVLATTLAFAFSGCWLANGIDAEAHIRPAKKDVPVVPAPPPDDWAPPWFRRPQPPKGSDATP